MIEVKRESKEDVMPIGAVLGTMEFVPHYVLYDIYESEVEFVEIWVPMKEAKDG